MRPQDVDQIHDGQPAVVQFAAFNRRTTPELNGEVIEHRRRRHAGRQAQREPTTPCASASPTARWLALDGLQPMAGMPVEVFIKTSPRTVCRIS